MARRYERHGMAKTKMHSVWKSMIQRCENPKDRAYKYYGKRGISVCLRWRNSFLAFYEDMGLCPTGQTLERTNNDGNYEPGNCCWATWGKQRSNTRIRKSYSRGSNRQRWFRAWHKDMMCQFMGNSQRKFAQKWKLNNCRISDCLRGINKKHLGWVFVWAEN